MERMSRKCFLGKTLPLVPGDSGLLLSLVDSPSERETVLDLVYKVECVLSR